MQRRRAAAAVARRRENGRVQPPPSASISSTVSAIRVPRMLTALSLSASSVACAVMTLRYVTVPALYWFVITVTDAPRTSRRHPAPGLPARGCGAPRGCPPRPETRRGRSADTMRRSRRTRPAPGRSAPLADRRRTTRSPTLSPRPTRSASARCEPRGAARALEAALRAERDGREVGGLGEADLGIRGGRGALRGCDVGPAAHSADTARRGREGARPVGPPGLATRL